MILRSRYNRAGYHTTILQPFSFSHFSRFFCSTKSSACLSVLLPSPLSSFPSFFLSGCIIIFSVLCCYHFCFSTSFLYVDYSKNPINANKYLTVGIKIKGFMTSVYIVVGRPHSWPETGLLSKTQKRIVQGDTCWQSKRFYWERAPGWRAVEWRNPGELLCHVAGSLGFYGDRISFQVIFTQLFWLRVLPGGEDLVQPRWMPARILGDGWTCGVSFWSFPNSSSWWWLINSMFITRTSCRKTTQANGYYGAWPGWAVSSQCASSNNIKTEEKKEKENKSEKLNPLPCSLSLCLCVYIFVFLCFGLMVNRNR